MSRAAELAPLVRRELEASVARTGESVALMLSAGIDSLVLGGALRELGRQVTAFTFCLDDRDSRDLRGALRAADALGIRCNVVRLSTDLDELEHEVREMIADGLSRKSQIECSWPMRVAIRAIGTFTPRRFTDMVSGVTADTYFVLTKGGMINARESVEKMDELRESWWSSPFSGQIGTTTEYAARYGLSYLAPYDWEPLRAIFRGTSWDEINTPRQKEVLRLLYPELEAEVRPGRHQNYQKGDSGISDLFQRAAERRGFASSTGWFNAMARDHEQPRIC